VATNNVSPEYGRFAGGVINMATKSGTNKFHGTAYEYYRNAALNANLYFNKHTPANVLNRPLFTQHQFGGTAGGPIRKDHTFFFSSWEEFSLRQAAQTTTTVPTAAMLAGNFSAICTGGFDATGICKNAAQQIYDPTNKSNGNRVPFANNVIPNSQLNATAKILGPLLFPAPTNSALTNNFLANVPRATVYNQYTLRFDHQLNAKNQLFARLTNWHRNRSGSSSLLNQIGSNSNFATLQAVLGDSFTLTPNLVGQARASYLRFRNQNIPFLCCDFQESTLGGNWGSYQSQIKYPQLPQPNITGFNNFSTGYTGRDTDNLYTFSGSLTWTVGRHTIQFGGESRRIEWGYVQTNSPGGTFVFDNTYSRSTAGTGGYSFASFMLGFPTSGSAQEPYDSLGTMYYSGAFVADSFRASKKLTVNVGLRWEQPGSYHDRNGSLTTLDLGLAQPALSAAAGRTITGGLDLVSSPRRPSRDWQDLHWALFSPRVGVAYSPSERWVARGGFGISYLPNTVAFSLGPYNNPPNSATTTMAATLMAPIRTPPLL